jgi:hypothetical protein
MISLFVASYGLGGPIWSGGLRTIANEAGAAGYETLVRLWWQAMGAARRVNEMDIDGALVVGGHSAGASFVNAFARQVNRPVDLAIYVDAWLPAMTPDKNIKRAISVQADRFGRFHVSGPGVSEQIVIPDTTHTTIDDSAALRALFRRELEALR